MPYTYICDMLDYLVVGLGLAGVSFCETLDQNGKTFTVFNDNSQQASKVAGGMYNPVILKRFTMAWKASEQLVEMLPFYEMVEKKLGITCVEKLQVIRRFASVEEQNGWFEAADKTMLQPFLATEVFSNENPVINAPFGYGEVLRTGKIAVSKLLLAYEGHLNEKGNLISKSFDFDKLVVTKDGVTYGNLKAKRLVFSEGFGMKLNPYFKYLPLTGTKGEYLIIKAPNLRESKAVKAGIFIIPEGNDLYRIGATYKWKDHTNAPTEASKIELIEKLTAILNCDFQVVDQLAGVRPTVTDRRPLVGRHPKYDKLFVLNGLGSRGVMIAPWAAKQLFNFIENKQAIAPEMNCSRFTKKYFLA